MKRKVILLFIINLIAVSYLAGQDEVRIMDDNSLLILSSNANIYQKSEERAEVITNVGMLDVLKIKNSNIVNNKIEVILDSNSNGWININDTSYIGNLDWRNFNNFKDINIYIPKEISFTFDPSKLNKGKYAKGNYMEYQIFNSVFFIDIAYNERIDELKIKKFITNSINGLNLTYYGYEAYYDNITSTVEGGFGYGLTILEKDRKKYYSISVMLRGNITPEQELTAKKILFSVRLKNANASGQTDSVGTNNIYTLTGDSVRMRTEAGTNGAVVAVLSKGARVKLLERKVEEVEIGGKVGHWAYVETEVKDKAGNAVKGFVFDAFLKEEGK
jgi:hypothetical protein